MNKWLNLILLLGCSFAGFANEKWHKFPDWTQAVLNQVNFADAPGDSSVWILLDDLALSMNAKGKIVVKRKLVQYVVRESGSIEGSAYLMSGDENSTKVKMLKGWHLGRSGKFDKLNKRDLVTIGDGFSGGLSRSTTSVAAFDDVSKGSIVAFESEEVEESFFPQKQYRVLEENPVREKRIRVSSQDASLQAQWETYGFENWAIEMTENSNGFVLKSLPAIASEAYTPDFFQAYPFIVVRYQGQSVKHMASWDEYASWYSDVFHKAAGSFGKGAPTGSLDAVSALVNQITESISYRQRYLSPGRGWVPANGADVIRRAYGDCKDMAACLAFEGSKKEVAVEPVLASIGKGYIPTASSKPGPIFNHLIAAVVLEKSLGLPAEVDVDGKKYLLVDPTSNHTQFGYLPAYYRDRHVMIALKDKAAWVQVPEAALEPEKLLVELNGMLDENYTLVGSLIIKETGNAMGYRTVSRENNPQALEGFLRRSLDLPGFMDLKTVNQEEAGGGQLSLMYQVRWPSFLMRDAGGLRLPFAIVDRPARRLSSESESRQLPIYFSGLPTVQWNLQIRCKTPVKPGLEQTRYEDDHFKFIWKASGGSSLNIQYLTERKEAYYKKGNIEKGLADWKAYRDAYNPFTLNGAALSPGE